MLFVNCDAQQNLVINPSFEDTLLAEDLSHLYLCSNWIVPTVVSTDWFSTDPNAHCYFCCCTTQSITATFGFEEPFSGEAISGIILYAGLPSKEPKAEYKEYIEGILSDELVAGHVYHVTVHFSLADSSNFAVNNFGLFFNEEIIDLWSQDNFSTSHLDHTPQLMFGDENYFQETDGWMTMTLDYIAEGGEKYFIIGSFQPNSSMIPIEVNPNAQSLKYLAHYFFDEIIIVDDSVNNLDESELLVEVTFENSCFHFSGEWEGSFEIYDSSGKLLQCIIYPESKVCADNLVQGFYLVVLRNNRGLVYRKKLVQTD